LKKLLTVSYILYLVGFTLKFFHLPYTTVLMIAALFGLLVGAIIAGTKKSSDVNPYIHIANLSWLLLLLFALKFLPFSNGVLAVAIILSLFAIFNAFQRKELHKLIAVACCMAIAFAFYFMSTDKRYYLVSIKWNYEIERDYRSLDKYAWFLYINGNKEKALEIEQEALETVIANPNKEWQEFIESHLEKIEDENWVSYR